MGSTRTMAHCSRMPSQSSSQFFLDGLNGENHLDSRTWELDVGTSNHADRWVVPLIRLPYSADYEKPYALEREQNFRCDQLEQKQNFGDKERVSEKKSGEAGTE